jgi:hypothetical protein
VPVEPSRYTSGPVSPQQLNTDLYSYAGTGFGANGILFLAHRPVLAETVTASRNLLVSTNGTWTIIQGSGTSGFNIIDTAALFGLGADSPGANAFYHFGAGATSAAGSAGQFGGQYLAVHFVTAPGFTGPATVGAGMYRQLSGTATPTLLSVGSMQRHFSGRDSCAPYVDILNVGGSANAIATWYPAAFYAAASGTASAMRFNATDTSGETPRSAWVWLGVTVNGSTVSSVPAPATNWGTVTSAALNVAAGSAMTFLYYPPILRQDDFLTTSIPNATGTKVPWTVAPDVDTYNGFGTATSIYTAPLPGMYLAFNTVAFTPNSTGARFSGFKVNSSNYQGPYNSAVATGDLTSVTQTRVFDLNAGDTVNTYCFQDSGGALTLAGASNASSRMLLIYVSPFGSGLTYTPPNTAFRWMAGQASGTALTSLLNTHLGNDTNFLINRPYFTGYQGTAQTGFTNNSGFHQLTIDTVGGLIHGSAGDNYGGWSAGNHWYAAPVAGWYLVVAEVFVTNPTTTTGYVTAGIFCSTSGGLTPTSTPDWYQHLFYNITSEGPTGACAIGLYYLAAGEYVYPMVQTQDWTAGTWGTSVSGGSGVYPQFSVFWICE